MEIPTKGSHLMSQFAGVGVNLAMIDVPDFAFALIRAPKGKPIIDIAKEYEEKMFERSKILAQRSADNTDIVLSDIAPKLLLDLHACRVLQVCHEDLSCHVNPWEATVTRK